MLQLHSDNIKLNQSSKDKLDAITAIAADLTTKGLVDDGYVDGMLNREAQNSTFLGNGIAIPHGTTDTRDLVQQTGVSVHHFPQGVDWGDGNTAYIAIGIAAKSDEHLAILKQLTKVLSADGIEHKLKQAKSESEIIALLNGEVQLEAEFDASLIQLNFPATDMVQLAAVAGGLLKNAGYAGPELVSDLVTKAPTHLGKGQWIVSSSKGVTRTAMAVVSTSNRCQLDGIPVHALIAFAACNNTHQQMLDKITELTFNQQQDKLLALSSEQLVALFTREHPITASTEDNIAVFRINNTHGLHARPGAMLVAEAKKFESTIRVSNLNGEDKSVNAKSLMKVIALGAKHGHELKFSAAGADADQALLAIGNAIASGLGEG
ncbi:fused PTS fructose transporter subunit IIA/HPr protein [Vibrio gallicus]|uniref:fused PTS fructose transporter subunit IIA/HPr protein n=1 Tax=Vibrio gallicus TaxID=190897 RepID=UPI0021C2E100|nr:fused PTS fructose transporter subunit IIA/HPr protein [Vibrio gallicus]